MEDTDFVLEWEFDCDGNILVDSDGPTIVLGAIFGVTVTNCILEFEELGDGIKDTDGDNESLVDLDADGDKEIDNDAELDKLINKLSLIELDGVKVLVIVGVFDDEFELLILGVRVCEFVVEIEVVGDDVSDEEEDGVLLEERLFDWEDVLLALLESVIDGVSVLDGVEVSVILLDWVFVTESLIDEVDDKDIVFVGVVDVVGVFDLLVVLVDDEDGVTETLIVALGVWVFELVDEIDIVTELLPDNEIEIEFDELKLIDDDADSEILVVLLSVILEDGVLVTDSVIELVLVILILGLLETDIDAVRLNDLLFVEVLDEDILIDVLFEGVRLSDIELELELDSLIEELGVLEFDSDILELGDGDVLVLIELVDDGVTLIVGVTEIELVTLIVEVGVTEFELVTLIVAVGVGVIEIELVLEILIVELGVFELETDILGVGVIVTELVTDILTCKTWKYFTL